MIFFDYQPLPSIENEEILEQMAELYMETWYEPNLPVGTYYFEPLFLKYWIKTYCDEEYIFSAFKNDNLIGLFLGKAVDLHFRVKLKENLPKKEILKGFVIGGAVMSKKFQRSNHMRNMLDTLISLLKTKNFDLILTFPYANSGIVEKLRDNFEFEILNKKANNYIGFLTEERFACQEEIQGKDILKKITETIAKPFILITKPFESLTGPISQKSLKSSPIKLNANHFVDVQENDYPKIVEILNSYSQKIDLNRIWTVEEFKKFVNGSLLLRELEQEEPGKYGFELKAWKQNGEMIGFISIHKRKTYYDGGILPTVYIDLFGFKQHVIINDKIKFFMNVFEEILDHRPNVCSINLNGCYHEMELINQLNFRPLKPEKKLMILKLSEKAKIINELKSIEYFNVPVIDF
ncbi:MAG: hypothetical protein EAX96_19730 [Candidatus Lokiarchaeota archaeon]|nr:hypothetical protein [Candidatus Lokiarchaeota archaeon]